MLDWQQRSVLGISVVGLARLGVGTGAALVAWLLEKFPSLLVLRTLVLLLKIRFYGLVLYIYCK